MYYESLFFERSSICWVSSSVGVLIFWAFTDKNKETDKHMKQHIRCELLWVEGCMIADHFHRL